MVLRTTGVDVKCCPPATDIQNRQAVVGQLGRPTQARGSRFEVCERFIVISIVFITGRVRARLFTS